MPHLELALSSGRVKSLKDFSGTYCHGAYMSPRSALSQIASIWDTNKSYETFYRVIANDINATIEMRLGHLETAQGGGLCRGKLKEVKGGSPRGRAPGRPRKMRGSLPDDEEKL